MAQSQDSWIRFHILAFVARVSEGQQSSRVGGKTSLVRSRKTGPEMQSRWRWPWRGLDSRLSWRLEKKRMAGPSRCSWLKVGTWAPPFTLCFSAGGGPRCLAHTYLLVNHSLIALLLQQGAFRQSCLRWWMPTCNCCRPLFKVDVPPLTWICRFSRAELPSLPCSMGAHHH